MSSVKPHGTEAACVERLYRSSWQPLTTVERRKKVSYEFRNNLNHPFGAGAAGCFADVGIQHFVGLCSRRDCRLAPGNRHHSGVIRTIVTAHTGSRRCKEAKHVESASLFRRLLTLET